MLRSSTEEVTAGYSSDTGPSSLSGCERSFSAAPCRRQEDGAPSPSPLSSSHTPHSSCSGPGSTSATLAGVQTTTLSKTPATTGSYCQYQPKLAQTANFTSLCSSYLLSFPSYLAKNDRLVEPSGNVCFRFPKCSENRSFLGLIWFSRKVLCISLFKYDVCVSLPIGVQRKFL